MEVPFTCEKLSAIDMKTMIAMPIVGGNTIKECNKVL
jgi:hypothetical protein